MPQEFFTSDTHFGHALVAGLRGFSSTREHDEEVIRRWNKAVVPEDTVWHLGDVFLGDYENGLACVARLNGTVHLVAGNHDKCFAGNPGAWKYAAAWTGKVFTSVQPYAVVKTGIPGAGPVLLSHFPYDGDHTPEDRDTQWRLPDKGRWLVHGHLHCQDKVTGPRRIHAGLDAWDLTPVRKDAIAAIITGKG